MNSDQIADILGQLAHTTREIWGDGPADGEELTRQKEALGERYEKAFYLIYGGTFGDRDGATELYQHLMDGGFFISPASAKHHLAVRFGLVAHTLNVVAAAIDLCTTEMFSGCDEDTVIRAALLHDICKMGKYKGTQSDGFQYQDNRMLGHGEESVIMAQQYMKLTDKEILCIRWHMGAYTGERDWNTLSRVYDTCPEAMCLHMADMIATHILEKAD